jgi:DNA polymerase III subunit epsilon
MATVAIDAEVLATALGRHGDYRVLRRLKPPQPTVREPAYPIRYGCAIDVETTGLDAEACRIIELGIQRFSFDADGRLVTIEDPVAWLEDPGHRLDPVISTLTGLCDEDLSGRAIDDHAATVFLNSVDVIVCHNAGFDRPFIERRLPAVRGLPWACTMRDVDWRAHGFEGRSLSQLLWQCGAFHEAHRAVDDVGALIALLAHELGDGRTVLAELVEHAEQPGWLIEAIGAPFQKKDVLKARGYRWDARARHWWREVPDDQWVDEELWLVAEVYAGCGGPQVRSIDWTERYRG